MNSKKTFSFVSSQSGAADFSAANRVAPFADPIETEYAAAPEAAAEGTHHGGADDALGLYLKQMGSIPLLKRDKELALALRLETARTRYRRAVLFNWLIIRKLVAIFQRVRAGEIPIDPNIDVITSAALTRDRILARMPYNLRTLAK